MLTTETKGRTARRSLGLLGALVATAALAGPAQAADQYTLQGVKGANDTCAFTSTIELKAGQQSMAARQVGFDAASCTITMEKAPAEAAAAAADAAIQSLSAPAPAALAAAAKSGVGTAAIFRTAGYTTSWLTNINGVQQNLVRNSVDYLYDGRHVGSGTCGAPYFQWNTSWWYAPRYDGAGKCQYNGPKTKVTASSKVNFFSPAGSYCSFSNDIWYNRHKTTGNNKGKLTDTVSFAGSSGCLSALYLHQQVVRTI